MGIYRQTVVDLEAPPEEAAARGEHGRRWLEAEGFIRPVPWRGDVAYLAGPQWREAVDLVSWDWRARLKGLEEEPCDALRVVVGRTVFYAGQGDAPSALCPHCRSALPDWPREALDAWYATGAADLDCPACARRAPLAEWNWTDDYFAFAHLGFEFDDWPPLHPRFTEAFGRALGHRIRLVQGKF
ncbi:hypothetical protein AB0B78_00790 [Streptomyces sp. NPDC040724]|uniref:hypothetical protein n=1 Tax=Streptomyces sp. NPDC040724 TaxID=3155612 RepID=UPI0033FE72A6